MNTYIHSLDTHERYTRSFCGYTCDQYTIYSLEAHVINHDTHIHSPDPHSFSRATCHAYIYSPDTREMHTHMHSLEKHAMNTHVHSLETNVIKIIYSFSRYTCHEYTHSFSKHRDTCNEYTHSFSK